MTELRAGHVAKAAEVAQALAAKDSSNPVYQTLLGLVRFVQHDYAGAETALRAVVAREPGFAPATQNLAQLYIATGRRDDAKKAYEALAAAKPGDATALLALADLAMADRHWKTAADDINRARSATRPETIDRARQSLPAAAGLPQRQITRRRDRGVVSEKYRSARRAGARSAGDRRCHRRRRHLSPRLRNGPDIDDDPRPLSRRVARRQGLCHRARRPRRGAGRRAGKSAIKGDLIRVEADIGGIDAGIAKAREFAGQDPKNPAYDLATAELYEKAGRLSRCDRAARKAASRAAGRAGHADARAALSARGAARQGRNAAEGPPRKGTGRCRGAACLGGANICSASSTILPASNMNGSSPGRRVRSSHSTTSWIYQKQGDLAKAKEAAERAVALAPRDAAIADTLGWIMIAQGDNAAALKYLKTAGASSRDPDIQYHLAVALQRTGQAADAKALLESILGSGGAFRSKADAEKLLQELQKG